MFCIKLVCFHVSRLVSDAIYTHFEKKNIQQADCLTKERFYFYHFFTLILLKEKRCCSIASFLKSSSFFTEFPASSEIFLIVILGFV